jgi:GTPase Era involved in 16S rRNA processing
MQDYSDHLNFTSEVIQRSGIPVSAQTELRKLLDRIKQRQNDPSLYLAVIGEFSSGKSTFINALLRDNLLKTSALVTTATSTLLRYGGSLSIRAEFKQVPQLIKVKPKSQSSNSHLFFWLSCAVCGFIIWFLNLQILFSIFLFPATYFLIEFISNLLKSNTSKSSISYIIDSSDLKVARIDTRQFIHQITSENDVAKDVESITITHPSNFLRNNVIIIDTPGTNATISEHAAITRNVVENKADAAIIMIPAIQPVSDTLLKFLKGSLYPYLDRCIFIVTYMDKLSIKEQDRQIKYIKQKLSEELNITSIDLHPAAAQVVIDELSLVTLKDTNQKKWKEKFCQTEAQIIDRLHRERSLSIAGSIERLFIQVFSQLDSYLKKQWDQYKQKQTAIERETIQDLNSFAKKQHEECNRLIERAATKASNGIDDCVSRARERTLSRIRDAIFGASNWDNLKFIVDSRLESILRENQQSLNAEIERECRYFSNSAEEAGKCFDQKFIGAYRQLQALGGRVQVNSVTISSSIQANTYSMFSSAKSISQGNFGNSVKGLLSKMFRGLLNERKEKIWDEVRPKIYSHFDECKSRARQFVKTDSQNIKTAINQHIDKYIAQYKATVDALLAEQQAELQRLKDLQVSVETDRQEMERRKKALLTTAKFS